MKFHHPMEPDIRWSAMACHASTLVVNGGHYNAIVTVENFKEDMKSVMSRIPAKHTLDIDAIPRFNESKGHGPKRAHSVGDYFDDLSMHLMHEIYARDFAVFNYDITDPNRSAPLGKIDLDKVQAMLGD